MLNPPLRSYNLGEDAENRPLAKPSGLNCQGTNMPAFYSPLLRYAMALAIATGTIMITETAEAGKRGHGAGFRLVIKPFLYHHFHHHHSSRRTRTSSADPCPQDFNCGHRVYADGTGPRIIQLGSGDTGNLDFDGPRIIRLKD